MEDAMILNKSAYERGFGHASVYKQIQVDIGADGKQGGRTSKKYFSNLKPSPEADRRTLIRRLKQESSSYQTLLDTSRQQRALWYLCHTPYTVEDIAARLGYTDTTNFSRTFRRWFGRAPGEVRRECQAC